MTKIKVPGTILRGGTYYSNIKIPTALRPHYSGKEHLRESLRTSDPATAKARLEIIRATLRADREHDARRKDLDRLVNALRPEDQAIFKAAGGLEGLIRRFEDGQIAQRFVQASAPVRHSGDDEDDRDDDVLETDLAAHQARLSTMKAQTNRDGKVLRRLEVDVALDGEVDSLRDVIDQWAPTVDSQTADAARYYVRRFHELHKEVAVKELDREHLRIFATEIADLPAVTSAKLPDGRFVRDLSFREAVDWAKRQKKPTLGDATRAKYVAMMKGLMAFAVGQGWRDDDPWASYRAPKVKAKHSAKQTEARRPFTPEEVRRILEHVRSSNDPKYGPTTVDFWAPWIAAHHGTRIQEVCQLRLCDFAERDGVWSMQITDEGENMRAKSGSTVRWVPVHPKLIEIGLRRHIEARAEGMPAEANAFNAWRGRTRGKLVELEMDSRGRVSGPYGKRFGHLREKKLKIVGGKVSFHSFRHRLQDAADTVGMPDSHRRYLTGRANRDAVEGGYGEGAAMSALLASLRRVDPMA